MVEFVRESKSLGNKIARDNSIRIRNSVNLFQFFPALGSVVQSKVIYGQEPPSGESTTTECGFNYQLLAVMY